MLIKCNIELSFFQVISFIIILYVKYTHKVRFPNPFLKAVFEQVLLASQIHVFWA